METYTITATHNGTFVRRFASWEFEAKSKAHAESQILGKEMRKWPPGTIWETTLKRIERLAVVDRGRGLKEPAQLNDETIKKVLSLFDPFTIMGRRLEELLVKNHNNPTRNRIVHHASFINKTLARAGFNKLILCSSYSTSQLWVLR